MNKEMQFFSFSPPVNLIEEEEWLLAVTSFEATNSVFNTTDENNSFSITTTGFRSSRGGAETIHTYKIVRTEISKWYWITRRRN